MLRAKTTILTVFLAAFAVWPLLHRVLVARYELSPWRFWGWAMYCMPKLDPDLDAYVVVDGERERLSLREPGLDRARRANNDFEDSRRMLGKLVEPDDVALEILMARPEVERLELDVERRFLDARSAHLAASTQTYFYDRTSP